MLNLKYLNMRPFTIEEIKKFQTIETIDTLPHESFEKRRWQIPDEYNEKLGNGQWHIQRHSLYTIIPVGGLQEIPNVFSVAPLMSNISKSQMPPYYFLLTSITLKYLPDDFEDFEIFNINNHYNIGEFGLKQQGCTYFENCPLSMFDKNGELRLSPPIMVYPEREIVFSIKWLSKKQKNVLLQVSLEGIRTIDWNS